jgi:hypothetical protein
MLTGFSGTGTGLGAVFFTAGLERGLFAASAGLAAVFFATGPEAGFFAVSLMAEVCFVFWGTAAAGLPGFNFEAGFVKVPVFFETETA